ncbi:MAG: class I SAM-dependent methyltransferase [Chloroflexi bacterium]|nr:class I SAM-dependent methyltransferase [Chloroflexota bacterium]
MSNVERYYDNGAQAEWARLDRDRVEFAVTLRALAEYLPPPPARVLDIGGGPGRYAIELAQRGYDVTLADISAAELALAQHMASERGVRISSFVKADARDLAALRDASFDAVLLMGPLYHLLEEADRRRAASEAVRVAKPGAIVMATNITRYAAIRWWAKHQPMQVVERATVYEQQIRTGMTPDAVGFTDLYLMRPAELPALFDGTGVAHIVTVACEGVVSMIRDKLHELDPEPWEFWMDLNYRLGKDPDTHGLAEHLLYIARKS